MVTNINRYIDHTLLKADATAAELEQLYIEAKKYGFHSVCVNSSNVKDAAIYLHNTGITICSVCGFPLGSMSTAAKVFEARQACIDGASEIDMVINIGRLKDGDFNYVEKDILSVAEEVHKHNALLKVIIETCLLTTDEKIRICKIAEKSGCDYLKTSTGFNSKGATVSDIQLMKQATNGRVPIKASGGIRTKSDAIAMIRAGADRLGTSASVSIVEDLAI